MDSKSERVVSSSHDFFHVCFASLRPWATGDWLAGWLYACCVCVCVCAWVRELRPTQRQSEKTRQHYQPTDWTADIDNTTDERRRERAIALRTTTIFKDTLHWVEWATHANDKTSFRCSMHPLEPRLTSSLVASSHFSVVLLSFSYSTFPSVFRYKFARIIYF